MNPSFTAFASELVLIKQAEEHYEKYQTMGGSEPKVAESDEPQGVPEPASAAPVQDEELQPFKSQAPTLAKERFKSALKFGLGHGLGAGVGFLAGERLLPKILPQTWTDATRRNVGFATGGLGAIGALALWDAYRQAAKAEEDAVKRDH